MMAVFLNLPNFLKKQNSEIAQKNISMDIVSNKTDNVFQNKDQTIENINTYSRPQFGEVVEESHAGKFWLIWEFHSTKN